MPYARARLLLAALLLLAAGAGAFTYFRYRGLSGRVADALGGQAAGTLGRQVRFGGVSFSPLRGVVIKDACVSRRPDFSKGSFFCAEKVVIRPSFAALARNKVRFSRVAFEKPVLKLREKDGHWDFEDLLALLPDTDKGLHLTWNAEELVMTGATLEADLETSGLSLALEEADLRLAHYSSYGGNYALQAGGRLKTVHNTKLVTAAARLDADLNFDYGGLASTSGRFSAQGIGYGAASLKALRADWKLFKLRKPLAEKNYALALAAEGLLVPQLDGAASARVDEALRLFSRITGKPAPAVEDLEAASLGAVFTLRDSRLAVKDIKLRTNFMALDAALAIDGPGRTADAFLKAELGASRLELSAAGPLQAPRLKPLLSATLAARIKEALLAAENSLLKIFPVTGD